MTAGEEVALHQAFRAALLALATPGRVYPVAGAPDAAEAGRRVIEAIWEPEAPPVVIVGAPEPGELLGLPRGSDDEPEGGTTVIVLINGAAEGTDVRLSGPGIDGELVARLPLSAGALAEREQACGSWPCGIDLLLIGPGPVVCGLPRTAQAELAA